jgi:hypothetical protein
MAMFKGWILDFRYPIAINADELKDSCQNLGKIMDDTFSGHNSCMIMTRFQSRSSPRFSILYDLAKNLALGLPSVLCSLKLKKQIMVSFWGPEWKEDVDASMSHVGFMMMVGAIESYAMLQLWKAV